MELESVRGEMGFFSAHNYNAKIKGQSDLAVVVVVEREKKSNSEEDRDGRRNVDVDGTNQLYFLLLRLLPT